ncbi:hypothetical protein EVAR_72632_1 [Eumeta japonica]|uniref:Uncharacterized protein n=1 Tax=Eumeta variegata TaxID=151549 RepID=A0A4C1TP93_EUMVA|nr:hypothetical protein EVAR_72632_1 [Eumeta japonica]
MPSGPGALFLRKRITILYSAAGIWRGGRGIRDELFSEVFGYHLRSGFGVVAIDPRAIGDWALWGCDFVVQLFLQLGAAGAGYSLCSLCLCCSLLLMLDGRSPQRDVDLGSRVVVLACASFTLSTSRSADVSTLAAVSKEDPRCNVSKEVWKYSQSMRCLDVACGEFEVHVPTVTRIGRCYVSMP